MRCTSLQLKTLYGRLRGSYGVTTFTSLPYISCKNVWAKVLKGVGLWAQIVWARIGFVRSEFAAPQWKVLKAVFSNRVRQHFRPWYDSVWLILTSHTGKSLPRLPLNSPLIIFFTHTNFLENRNITRPAQMKSGFIWYMSKYTLEILWVCRFSVGSIIKLTSILLIRYIQTL